MSYRDLHIKPFDKGTIAKLEIFEDYAQAWLPTFIMQPDRFPEIHIFDFFSGPGYDSDDIPGSPMRVLQKIQEQLDNILAKKTKVVLHFNEYEPTKKGQQKFELLQHNCNDFIAANPKFKSFLTVNRYNENAAELFFKLLPKITTYPSLVYLDQNGVKFISKKYLAELEKLDTTDFLYFVSSSYFTRLGGTNEFRKVLEIEKWEIEKEAYRNIHRLVLNKIKLQLPSSTELMLFPFSIKKNANIYGIVFGSKKYAAVDKFLDIAWKRNSINGEADFDIDEDNSKVQLVLFGEKKMTKIEKFQQEFEHHLMEGNFPDNKAALLYTYGCGHIPKHAVDIIRKLKKDKKIDYVGTTPALNYLNVFRKGNIVKYTINK